MVVRNVSSLFERFIMLLSTTTVESLKAVGAVAAFAAMDANCDGLSTGNTAPRLFGVCLSN